MVVRNEPHFLIIVRGCILDGKSARTASSEYVGGRYARPAVTRTFLQYCGSLFISFRFWPSCDCIALTSQKEAVGWSQERTIHALDRDFHLFHRVLEMRGLPKESIVGSLTNYIRNLGQNRVVIYPSLVSKIESLCFIYAFIGSFSFWVSSSTKEPAVSRVELDRWTARD